MLYALVIGKRALEPTIEDIYGHIAMVGGMARTSRS
jgi:hypothetical protein